MSCSIFDSDCVTDVTWTLVGKIPGDSELQRIVIPAAGATVGRSGEGTNVVVSSGFVSNRHAILSPRGPVLEVRDLESRNGTFLQCERIHGSAYASHGDTVAFADVEFRVEMSETPWETADGVSQATVLGMESFHGHWTLSNFARLVQDRLVIPFVQPIVEIGSRRVMGLESLARSTVPGLETPAKMFEAAELLDQAAMLSAICRGNSIEAVRHLPGSQRLFLNTHPAERMTQDILQSIQELRKSVPTLRLVIEIHEDLIGELEEARTFFRELAGLGVEVALDDFGAGKDRIKEILRLRPAFVKFDRSLICNIDQTPAAELPAIKSLIDLLKTLSIRCIAEGVERRAEAKTCRELGFELAQGFYFGRPSSVDQSPAIQGREFASTRDTGRLRPNTDEYSILPDL